MGIRYKTSISLYVYCIANHIIAAKQIYPTAFFCLSIETNNHTITSKSALLSHNRNVHAIIAAQTCGTHGVYLAQRGSATACKLKKTDSYLPLRAD